MCRAPLLNYAPLPHLNDSTLASACLGHPCPPPANDPTPRNGSPRAGRASTLPTILEDDSFEQRLTLCGGGGRLDGLSPPADSLFDDDDLLMAAVEARLQHLLLIKQQRLKQRQHLQQQQQLEQQQQAAAVASAAQALQHLQLQNSGPCLADGPVCSTAAAMPRLVAMAPAELQLAPNTPRGPCPSPRAPSPTSPPHPDDTLGSFDAVVHLNLQPREWAMGCCGSSASAGMALAAPHNKNHNSLGPQMPHACQLAMPAPVLPQQPGSGCGPQQHQAALMAAAAAASPAALQLLLQQQQAAQLLQLPQELLMLLAQQC